MAIAFDPYVEWLSVTEKRRPLTYYSMLDLKTFENDASRIAMAIERAIQQVRPHLNGERAQLAKRTMLEIESARACLLDAAKKARYDQRLRSPAPAGSPAGAASTAAVARTAVAAKPATTMAEPALDDFLLENLPDASPDLSALGSQAAMGTPLGFPLGAPRSKSKVSPEILWSSIAGGVVILGLMVAVGVKMSRSSDVPELAPPVAPPPVAQQNNPVTVASARKLPPPPPPSGTPVKIRQLLQPARADDKPMVKPAADDAQSVVQVAVESADVPVVLDPFTNLTSELRLPSISPETLNQPLKLAKLNLADDSKLDLKLSNPNYEGVSKCALVKLPGGNPAAPTWEVHQTVAGAGVANKPIPIAAIALQNNDLTFKWLTGSREAKANELRNCCLKISVGSDSRSVALRGAHLTAPLTLDLDDSIPPIQVEGEWLPDKSVLLLQLVKIEGLDETPTNLPVGQIVAQDDDIKMSLREVLPRVEIKIRFLYASDKPTIKLLPTMIDGSNNSLPFTTERVNTMLTKLPKEIADTQNRIVAIQREQQSVNYQLSSAAGASASNQVEAAQRANLIGQLQRQLGDLVKKERDAFQRLNLLGTRLESVSPLVPLGNQWHKKARFYFRVFFMVGGREVDVLTMN